MLRKFFLSLLLLFSSLPLAAAPKVVVSIAPVHSLVAGVMDGVGEPTLLIPPGASPHAYALKPSAARALSSAQLVIWIGEGLEPMLEKPLHSMAASARVVEVAAMQGIKRLPNREGGVWGEAHHEDEHEEHGHGEMDMHLWLAPDNARRIAVVVADELSKLDPANVDRYQRNARMVRQRVDALEDSLGRQLGRLSTRPYIVFHDAYHYFEEAFGLHPAGSISVSPDRPPGARRIAEIRKTIRTRNAACVFSEPQFQPRIVKVVLEGSGARYGMLDPMGATLKPGRAQWFELMQGLADNLSTCLQP